MATGEHVQNRIIFKQLLQADAIRFCQIDACRLGGVNEVLAVLLMAAKFGVPVCPHAGGVGLCEYVQHLSIFDYIAVSASLDDRIIEYVDHLHEHFFDPVVDGPLEFISIIFDNITVFSICRHRNARGLRMQEEPRTELCQLSPVSFSSLSNFVLSWARKPNNAVDSTKTI